MRIAITDLACIIISVFVVIALEAGAASLPTSKTNYTITLASSGYGGAEKSTYDKNSSSGGSRTFQNPTYNGKQVDASLDGKTAPGRAAADKFCVSKGYISAKSWNIITVDGSVAPTIRIGDGTTCKQASCVAFVSIECQ